MQATVAVLIAAAVGFGAEVTTGAHDGFHSSVIGEPRSAASGAQNGTPVGVGDGPSYPSTGEEARRAPAATPPPSGEAMMLTFRSGAGTKAWVTAVRRARRPGPAGTNARSTMVRRLRVAPGNRPRGEALVERVRDSVGLSKEPAPHQARASPGRILRRAQRGRVEEQVDAADTEQTVEALGVPVGAGGRSPSPLTRRRRWPRGPRMAGARHHRSPSPRGGADDRRASSTTGTSCSTAQSR